MQIKNELEEVVHKSVLELKERGNGGGQHCWCVLCEADVTALALTSLPPRYATVYQEPAEMKKEKSITVENAVRRSRKCVSHRPKHRLSSPENWPSRVRLVNYNYEEAISRLASFARLSDQYCSCALCHSDTIAYALNRYPPRYGVMYSGRTKLPGYQLDYLRHELDLVLTHAAGIVASSPRHQGRSDH